MTTADIVCLIAPPAAGKGTQSAVLCEKGFTSVSMSAILYREFPDLQERMAVGKLLDCNMVIQAMQSEFNGGPLGRRVLDGAPRTRRQAEWIIERFSDHRVIFVIMEASDEVLEERLLKRIQWCKDNDVPLRRDDNIETLHKRIRLYRSELETLQPFLHREAPKQTFIVGAELDASIVSRLIEEIVFTDIRTRQYA